MKSKVSVVKCKDYTREGVEIAVRQAVDLIGGISPFIKSKSRVLLKPNLLMAIEPESGIITHPEVIRAVIRLLKEINAEIFLGDSPSVWGKPQDIKEVYKRSGMKQLAEEERIELVEFQERAFKGDFPMTDFLNKVSYVISIPKFKTHDLTVLTGAVKNLFGLIPGLYKTELHKSYFKIDEFAKKLVDIYEAAPPVLNIVDAVDAIEGDGPGRGGDLRHVGFILAGSDAIALDSILAKIMNLMPQDIPTIKEAKRRALGNADLDSIELKGESLSDIAIADFKLPQPSIVGKIPLGLFSMFKGLINYRPQIDAKICTRCKRCQEACPTKVITIGESLKIDYSNCIKCFCCLEVCPEGAVFIRRSLLAKILGLRG